MPSVLKYKMFSPPYAAAYWSCFPIGSFRISISISHAPLASSSADLYCLLMANKLCNRPTVNDDDEPMPVPAGMSAIELISIPPFIPVFFSDSLRIGCLSSSTLLTVSVFEYFTLNWSLKKNLWDEIYIYLSMDVLSTAPWCLE